MQNIQGKINKLLLGLSTKGKIYRINTFRIFSKKKWKYVTKYQLSKLVIEQVYNEEENRFIDIEKYKVVVDTFDNVEILKYLVDEFKGVSK